MAGDLRVDNLGAQGLEPAEGAFLVGLDQPRIARHIRRQYRREPALDPFTLPETHRGSPLSRKILHRPPRLRHARSPPAGHPAMPRLLRAAVAVTLLTSGVPWCFSAKPDLFPCSADIIPSSVA